MQHRGELPGQRLLERNRLEVGFPGLLRITRNLLVRGQPIQRTAVQDAIIGDVGIGCEQLLAERDGALASLDGLRVGLRLAGERERSAEHISKCWIYKRDVPGSRSRADRGNRSQSSRTARRVRGRGPVVRSSPVPGTTVRGAIGTAGFVGSVGEEFLQQDDRPIDRLLPFITTVARESRPAPGHPPPREAPDRDHARPGRVPGRGLGSSGGRGRNDSKGCRLRCARRSNRGASACGQVQIGPPSTRACGPNPR